MKKRIIALVAALALMAGTLAGCAKPAREQQPSTESQVTRNSQEPSSAAPSRDSGQESEAQTQTIVDMGGEEVAIPKEIHTIVDTWSAATDNLFNLGAADLLVSAHPAAVSEVSALVAPGFADLDDYSKATAEELLALNPDLVIVSNNDKAEEFRDAGLNAVNLVYMTYEDFKKSTLLMGQILGGEYEKRAEELGEYVDWVSQTLADDLKDIPEEEKPVVHYIMTSDVSNLYSSCGGGSIMDEWVSLAGGRLATADLGKGMGLKDVTAEQILATNPDVIMIDGDNAAEVREALRTSEEWAGITAVRDDAIYCIPKGCFWWGRLCGDTPLQALWAASVLYPEQVSYDIHEQTKEYYSKFKKCDLSDEQVDSILRTDLLP